LSSIEAEIYFPTVVFYGVAGVSQSALFHWKAWAIISRYWEEVRFFNEIDVGMWFCSVRFFGLNYFEEARRSTNSENAETVPVT
jgi:hypothetical protein